MHCSHSCIGMGLSHYAVSCMGVGLVPYASVGNFLNVNVLAERIATPLVHSMTKTKSKVFLEAVPEYV